MKVLRHNETPESPAANPIFVGTVHTRAMVSAQDSTQVTVVLVRFLDGARNVLHAHGADQVLYITEGHGLVGTSEHDHAVEAGDIVHIPQGEAHWHGAQPGARWPTSRSSHPVRRASWSNRRPRNAGALMGMHRRSDALPGGDSISGTWFAAPVVRA
jgi:quercetin dioxygenase-like cupin family protein